MTDEADPPQPPTGPVAFERDVFIDKPGIVGARWWHKSLIAEDAAMRRRAVLKSIATVGGAAAGIALFGYAVTKIAEGTPPEAVKLDTRTSLDMQRKYGWDFGARGQPLVFDGTATAPFNRADLANLPRVMQPPTYASFAVPTLLESLNASPTATLPEPPDGSPAEDSAPFHRLVEFIHPVGESTSMRRAYAVGVAMARLAKDRATTLAVLVDLEGTESVAFAAGASEVFEPVLLLDNWPHPRGVVPAHMVLAALAYYQPRFAAQAKARAAAHAPPLFVLDRSRLNAYSEDSTRFDNRYYARPPSPSVLATRGVKQLLYVVASMAFLPQPADLDVLAHPEPTTARALTVADFSIPEGDGPAYYGRSAETDASIWVNYPFVDGYSLPAGSRVADSTSKDYRFAPRADAASKLPVIGMTAIAVTASGLLVAAALDRRGSMNRFSGGWGG